MKSELKKVIKSSEAHPMFEGELARLNVKLQRMFGGRLRSSRRIRKPEKAKIYEHRPMHDMATPRRCHIHNCKSPATKERYTHSVTGAIDKSSKRYVCSIH